MVQRGFEPQDFLASDHYLHHRVSVQIEQLRWCLVWCWQMWGAGQQNLILKSHLGYTFPKPGLRCLATCLVLFHSALRTLSKLYFFTGRGLFSLFCSSRPLLPLGSNVSFYLLGSNRISSPPWLLQTWSSATSIMPRFVSPTLFSWSKTSSGATVLAHYY